MHGYLNFGPVPVSGNVSNTDSCQTKLGHGVRHVQPCQGQNRAKKEIWALLDIKTKVINGCYLKPAIQLIIGLTLPRSYLLPNSSLLLPFPSFGTTSSTSQTEVHRLTKLRSHRRNSKGDSDKPVAMMTNKQHGRSAVLQQQQRACLVKGGSEEVRK